MLVIYLNKINFKLKITLRNVIILVVTVLLSYYSFDSIFTYLQEQEIQVSENQVLIFLIFCLSVGLFEELLFRVFVFKSIFRSNNNLMKSTFIASLFFAFAHLGNLFNPDYFVFSVIIQIIFAFGIGFLLQSIFIKFNNLSIPIFIHGMINFFGSYKSRFLVYNNTEISDSYELSRFITSLIFVSVLSFIFIVIGKVIIKSSKQFKKQST